MKKDPDKIASIEKAIAKKYGKEAVQNPKGNWDDQKEKEYLDQIRKFEEKHRKAQMTSEKVDVNGVLISKKLLNRESNRSCPVCDKYSFNMKDDVYYIKFNCCFECYINFVEGREERWDNGWRPNSGENRTNGNNT